MNFYEIDIVCLSDIFSHDESIGSNKILKLLKRRELMGMVVLRFVSKIPSNSEKSILTLILTF